METAVAPEALRVVGGDLSVDFVNTQTGPAGSPPDGEALNAYADLLAWGRLIGVVSSRTLARLSHQASQDLPKAACVLEEALRVRSYLYEIFSGLAKTGRAPKAALGYLRSDEARAIGQAELVWDGARCDWSWANSAGLDMPLWPVVHAATTLLTGGPAGRVRNCAACRFLFVDQSKNGSRRWCSMQDCGTIEKTRLYVARRSVSRAATATRATSD